MSKSIRDLRQEEFAEMWLNSDRKKILNLCPRFGKIRTSIKILEKIEKQPEWKSYSKKKPSVLIAYPDNKIKDSWKSDFQTLNYDDSNVTYTTHLSLKKYNKQTFDIIIIDEIHLLSEAQIEICKELFSFNYNILGLTGTLSKWTETTLNKELDLHVLATYSIEKAIEEKVIADYSIKVYRVSLDNITQQSFNGKSRTEKKQFDVLTWMINKLEEEGKPTMFLRLGRMRIIQKSLAKLNYTKKLLKDSPKERILVFCGIIDIADKLGIPSYHSKTSEKTLLADFSEGIGNHLAVVKIGNAGVTYKPLNKVIINYFDSNSENLAQKINRCMSYEYDTPDKKAEIIIISTNEPTELKWLNKALEFFDKSKITFM